MSVSLTRHSPLPAANVPARKLVFAAVFACLVTPFLLAQICTLIVHLGDMEFDKDHPGTALSWYKLANVLYRANTFAESPAISRKLGECLALNGDLGEGITLVTAAERTAFANGDFDEACHAALTRWRIDQVCGSTKARQWLGHGLCSSRLLDKQSQQRWLVQLCAHLIEEDITIQDKDYPEQSSIDKPNDSSSDALNTDNSNKPNDNSSDELNTDNSTTLYGSLSHAVCSLFLTTGNLARSDKYYVECQPVESSEIENRRQYLKRAKELYQRIETAQLSSLRKSELFSTLAKCSPDKPFSSDCVKRSYELRKLVLGSNNLFTASAKIKWLQDDTRVPLETMSRGISQAIDVESAALKYVPHEVIWDQIARAVAPYELPPPEWNPYWLSYWYTRASQIQEQATGKADMRMGVLLYHRGLFGQARPILQKVVDRHRTPISVDPAAPEVCYDSFHAAAFAALDLARILRAQDEYKKAIDLYRQAVRLLPAVLDPSTNDLRLEACDFFFETGQFNDVRAVLDQWRASCDPAETRAQIWPSQQRVELEFNVRTSTGKPLDTKFNHRLLVADDVESAACLLLIDRNEEALNILQKLIKKHPGDNLVQLNLVVALNRLSQFEAAARLVDDALQSLVSTQNTTPSLYAALLNCKAVSESQSRVNCEQNQLAEHYLLRARDLLNKCGLSQGLVAQVVERNLRKLNQPSSKQKGAPWLDDTPLLSSYQRESERDAGSYLLNMDECWRCIELF